MLESIRGMIERRLKNNQERQEPKSKQFLLVDWREPAEAKKHGVEPGFYFVISPVSQIELQNPKILNKLAFPMMKELQTSHPLPTSDTSITINAQDHSVDPALAWEFIPTGYVAEDKLLVIRAKPVDQMEAQGRIVKAVRDKTAKTIYPPDKE